MPLSIPSFLAHRTALTTASSPSSLSPRATIQRLSTAVSMDFKDCGSSSPVGPHPLIPSSPAGTARFDVSLTPPANAVLWRHVLQGEGIRRNGCEQERLQGLMRSGAVVDQGGGQERKKEKGGMGDRFRVGMVNDGELRLLETPTDGKVRSQRLYVDPLARGTYGITYVIARAAALVLHVDVAFILLPVCRGLVSVLRRGPLSSIVPFEKNFAFRESAPTWVAKVDCRCVTIDFVPTRADKAVAWSIVFFTAVHAISHLFNAWWLGELATPTLAGRLAVALEVNFATGPGVTGWLMVLSLGTMVYFAQENRKRTHFERFYYSHLLFVPFFVCWQLHGMFCMIKPDRPPYCSWINIGVFWRFILVSLLIFLAERLLREIRSRHRTWITKVVLHPGPVVEVQFRKEKTTMRAGQYVLLNCPEISFAQWHPFTLSSAPEEDYISVHIRELPPPTRNARQLLTRVRLAGIIGDFTRAFAEALGCELPAKGDRPNQDVGAQVVPLSVNRVLPRIMIDGPFGSASEDVFKYEVSVLVAAGIGVTPFASVLKHICFFWICRDFVSFEWFQSLLLALEAQDLSNYIEIHTYLTARVVEDDMNNIIANEVGADRDAVTSLKAPTHYGRPNWDVLFRSIAAAHASTDVGVFFCGPKPLGSTLHKMCNKVCFLSLLPPRSEREPDTHARVDEQYTEPKEEGVRFYWGKENF
ncbi:SPOSA6832_00566 [Sporobolomyces salmonicolor]|uniref:SPOSA6832_00566-mRNA-1:cds n=1 Tax=Sporidiobolus salmonicolor TaxID=5005 RepID=A0A0D6EGI5_SPOSA|nr:SPOSA6832_00566 [Sporobolomyces salmonicolor]